MKAIGITAEYNPFHRGHKYLIEEARRRSGADCVVAVMSGDFTQRGEPAVCSKWHRAAMAVEAGADLVVELPYMYACAGSGEFARGAMAVMKGLGAVDYLAFGCEADDVDMLRHGARALRESSMSATSPAAVRAAELKGQGMPLSEARSRSISELYGQPVAELLRSPNNLLACEYVAAAADVDFQPELIAVKRIGSGHDAPGMSGKAIRAMLTSEDFSKEHIGSMLPDELADSIMDLKSKGLLCLDLSQLFLLLRYKIAISNGEKLSRIYDLSEGIENRMLSVMSDIEAGRLDISTYSEFLDAVKTKRFTRARISRMLMHILADYTYDDHDRLVGTAYARILAANRKGTAFLKDISKREVCTIPVISNLGSMDKEISQKVLESIALDIKASKIYTMIVGRSEDGIGEIRRIPYIKP